MGMDLAKLGSAAAADITLELQLNGEPAVDDDGTKIVLTFHGLDAPQTKAARNTLVTALRALSARSAEGNVVEEQALNATFLAAVTKSWTRMPAFGERLEYNQKNAERVYARIDWVRRQVDEFLIDLQKKQAKGARSGFLDGAAAPPVITSDPSPRA